MIPEDTNPESGTLLALKLKPECAGPYEGDDGLAADVDAEGNAADREIAPVPSIVVPCIGGSDNGCCVGCPKNGLEGQV